MKFIFIIYVSPVPVKSTLREATTGEKKRPRRAVVAYPIRRSGEVSYP